MGTLHLTADRLQIRLSLREKIAGLHRDLDIPRSAIRTVEVVDDGLSAVPGVRAPGLALPGRVKAGTWRGRGGRRYVSVRRGQPTLRLTLDGERYDGVLVSSPDAAAVAVQLRERS